MNRCVPALQNLRLRLLDQSIDVGAIRIREREKKNLSLLAVCVGAKGGNARESQTDAQTEKKDKKGAGIPYGNKLLASTRKVTLSFCTSVNWTSEPGFERLALCRSQHFARARPQSLPVAGSLPDDLYLKDHDRRLDRLLLPQVGQVLLRKTVCNQLQFPNWLAPLRTIFVRLHILSTRLNLLGPA